MNNYSYIEKTLHQFVLSSNFIKNYTYELESLFFKDCLGEYDDNHVFVSGLARSGTTILLNNIYKSKEFASLTYADMPFVLAPNIWERIQPSIEHKASKERVHKDGIYISTNSPEAFEEVFWHSIKGSYSEKKIINYIRLILLKAKKHRYLSKNNQNVWRLKKVRELFPNSVILIPFRYPVQQANSLINQHHRFIQIQKKDTFIKKYMDWIYHSEFGLSYKPIASGSIQYPDFNSLNHWLEQWLRVYSKLFKEFNNDNKTIFVCYEKLCSRNNYWTKLRDKLQIRSDYKTNFKNSDTKLELEYDTALYDSSDRLYKILSEREFD